MYNESEDIYLSALLWEDDMGDENTNNITKYIVLTMCQVLSYNTWFSQRTYELGTIFIIPRYISEKKKMFTVEKGKPLWEVK